jgi:hypothetical protein
VSDGGYRDARAGVVEHLREAELAVAERTARVTPALTRILPEELRARIAELRAANEVADDAQLEELTRVLDVRAALLDALDEAIALAPSLAATLRNVPDGVPSVPPQDDPWGPAGTEEAMVLLLHSARASAWPLDPDAEISPSGARIVGRLTVDRVPLLWLVELGAWMNGNQSPIGGATLTFLRSKQLVEVNVSAALGRLVVRPRGLGDAVRKLLHLDHGLHSGDRAFDDAFFVEGDEAFARPLLTDAVKTRLLESLRHRSFHVVLEGGVASVAWTSLGGDSHFGAEPLGSAVRVLLALRQSAESLELVR